MQAFPRDEPDARPDRTPDLSPPRYWFPAKTYGWGWGLPSTREGWVVLVGYLGLLVTLVLLVPVARHPNWFWAGFGTIDAGLSAICWWTGEPLRWRWG